MVTQAEFDALARDVKFLRAEVRRLSERLARTESAVALTARADEPTKLNTRASAAQPGAPA